MTERHYGSPRPTDEASQLPTGQPVHGDEDFPNSDNGDVDCPGESLDVSDDFLEVGDDWLEVD